MTPLDRYRDQIDALDTELMALLGRRMDVCRDVARYKRAAELSVVQPAREALVRDRFRQRAVDSRLSAAFGTALGDAILAEAHRLEEEILAAPPERGGRA